MADHKTEPYVRGKLIAESRPPLRQRGILAWLRQYVFASWTTAALTGLSLCLVWLAVAPIMPWLANSIWHAGSLTECREIRNATLGPEANVACFAVITDRWKQIFFGFYPQDQLWRPLLAIVVFLAGIWPILFNFLSRRLLLLPLLAPFAAYWLLWGGSAWGPVFASLGLMVNGTIFVVALRRQGTFWAFIAATIFALIYWVFAANYVSALANNLLPLQLESVQSKSFGGFLLCFVIGLSGIVLSLPLGVALAMGRQSSLPIIAAICISFIEIVRGVPLIFWLFTASLLIEYFLPPGVDFDLMLRVIIVVSLFSSAYIAEVVRGGLAALPKGQYEAASSLGLKYSLSMALIILPQALKISIPGIVSIFIGLFKDTTLVVFIGLLDPIGLSNTIRASTDWNGIYWELFIFIGAVFFVICYSMSRYASYLEKRLTKNHDS